MTRLLIAVLVCALPAFGHRLDEYLQATLVSVQSQQVQVQVRLTPGIAVLPTVLAMIDTNGDGVLTDAEQRTYAERVLRDVSLQSDGSVVRLRLSSAKFPKMEELKEGLGAIQLDFTGSLFGHGGDRRLRLDNHHQPAISAYLVNALAPQDARIRVIAQNRNYLQSSYELQYSQTRQGSTAPLWVGLGALLACGRLALLFRAG